MKVLIACEFSGVVREAFRKRGHDAWSCDLLPALDGSEFHFQMPIYDLLEEERTVGEGFDLIVSHPPCTYLSGAGNKHYANRPDLYEPAAEFAMSFFDYADRVAVENPIGRLSRLWRKPDQIVQPYWFGDPFEKRTCLWLKNLPKLEPTNMVEPEPRVIFSSGKSMPAWYNLPPSKERSNLRSITFQGFAEAMAIQWS